MELGFTIRTNIPRPINEVFDAIVDPEKLSSYFTSSASAPLEEATQVTWTWGPDTAIVEVLEVRQDERIAFSWPAHEVDYDTAVVIEFEEEEDGGTLVSVTETDWDEDEDGLMSSYEHCAGWQHMLLSLKAWLLYGIDLRSGAK